MTAAQRTGRSRWTCLLSAGCLVIIILAAGAVALFFGVIVGAMKASDAYKLAMERARSNPEVVAALGSPIEAGYFVSGSVSVSGGSGEAKLSIPISGPNGSGTLYVEATKQAGVWHFSVLMVEVDATGQRIDLLGGESDSISVRNSPLPAFRDPPAGVDPCRVGAA